MKTVILFHPKKGVFFAAMTRTQMDRWRHFNGFVLYSWEYRHPNEDDLMSFLQFLSVNIVGNTAWSTMIGDFVKTHKGIQFRRLLREVSLGLQHGSSFENALRKFLPTQLSMSVLYAQKRGQLSEEISKIIEGYRNEMDENVKRRSKQIYPLTLALGLVGLITLVDFQFVPVLRSLFDSYGLKPPFILTLFNFKVQLVILSVFLGIGGLSRWAFINMSFHQKAHIPFLGQISTLQLHQHLLDAYQESLIRECSFSLVLEERYPAERNRFVKFGLSTIAGRLIQGTPLSVAIKEIPAIRGWAGGWVRGGALVAYQKQLRSQETLLKDRLQAVLVATLIALVSLIIAGLGFLITLPLQYADRLI